MQIVPYPFTKSGQTLIRRSLIDQQGNVIFPTETHYAVGCLANSSTAVNHIYHLKKRSRSSPLLVLINSWEMLDRYMGNITHKQRCLLEQYWPGALTAILPYRGNLSPELNLSGESLAFRMTSSPIAKELIGLVNIPLVGTSANLSGAKEIDSFEQAYQTFGDHVELYIDGGSTPGGKSTTLINMVDTNHFSILRQGDLELTN
ncbi:MAG: threonylcarbamoyl-AMP synthase [Proteobacteria bacterium]|nr:threonylcarbamoyl-AMP synthase [Pseudomonadota bacterium]